MNEMINTGMQRATELTVTKIIGGVSANGYPRIYKVYDAFGNYASITKDELAKISVSDYKVRLSAFKAHVESIEVGVTVDIEVAYKQNLGVCPIG
ncbi:hypothetical protein [Bacteroides sp.]